MRRSAYDVLGLRPDADERAILTAWRRSAKRCHPDAGGDSEAFAEAVDAYATLSDPLRRAAHDRELAPVPGRDAGDEAWAHSFDSRVGGQPRRSPPPPSPANASRPREATPPPWSAAPARPVLGPVLGARQLLLGGFAVLGVLLACCVLVDLHVPEALLHPVLGERLALGLRYDGPPFVALGPERLVSALGLFPFAIIAAVPWHLRTEWRPFPPLERAAILVALVVLGSCGVYVLTGWRPLGVLGLLVAYVVLTARRTRAES